HPAKREVKFRDDWMVRRFVTNSVRQALLAYHAPAAPVPVPHADQAGSDALPTANPPLEQGWIDYSAPPPSPPLPTPFAATAPTPTLPPPTAMPPATPAFNAAPPAIAVPSTGQGLESTPDVPRPNASALTGPTPDAASPEAPPPPLLSVPLRFVGVIGHLYVVLESDRGLVLMDQHAAHERVLFEQMLERFEHSNAPSQRLLLPETVELSPRDAAFLREHLATLSRLGVGLSEFGERTFLLDALPPFVRTPDPRQFVLELIDGLKAAGHDVNSMRLGEDMVAKTVCRHAVKAHDPLVGVELEKLVEDLRRCAMPYTCPHGRPTLLEFDYRELEKKFGRSQ
ncbi:MAG TPA: DNA mismatch repair protein MutL, partial [Verrucomicrobiota bacterium]|nr:DNA mismatch repair protein MutL [Verrucomicrobiota bacterium]